MVSSTHSRSLTSPFYVLLRDMSSPIQTRRATSLGRPPPRFLFYMQYIFSGHLHLRPDHPLEKMIKPGTFSPAKGVPFHFLFDNAVHGNRDKTASISSGCSQGLAKITSPWYIDLAVVKIARSFHEEIAELDQCHGRALFSIQFLVFTRRYCFFAQQTRPASHHWVAGLVRVGFMRYFYA